jgi:hypothetical protein
MSYEWRVESGEWRGSKFRVQSLVCTFVIPDFPFVNSERAQITVDADQHKAATLAHWHIGILAHWHIGTLKKIVLPFFPGHTIRQFTAHPDFPFTALAAG